MAQPEPITHQLSVTAQPGNADIASFAQLGYRTIINNRPDGEEPGQLSAAEAKAEAERALMAYVHLPVKLAPSREAMWKPSSERCAKARSRWWRLSSLPALVARLKEGA